MSQQPLTTIATTASTALSKAASGIGLPSKNILISEAKFAQYSVTPQMMKNRLSGSTRPDVAPLDPARDQLALLGNDRLDLGV
jgi:hypothetical protein